MNLQSARHFVNRLKELAAIKRSVTESQPGAATQECVTNFYGVPGIGKSALLADIYQLYKQDLALLTLAAERILRDNLPAQYAKRIDLSQAHISCDSVNEDSAPQPTEGIILEIIRKLIVIIHDLTNENKKLEEANQNSNKGAIYPSFLDKEDLEEEADDLRERWRLYNRRLHILQNQEATEGIKVDPSIPLQIRSIKRQMVEIKEQELEIAHRIDGLKNSFLI